MTSSHSSSLVWRRGSKGWAYSCCHGWTTPSEQKSSARRTDGHPSHNNSRRCTHSPWWIFTFICRSVGCVLADDPLCECTHARHQPAHMPWSSKTMLAINRLYRKGMHATVSCQPKQASTITPMCSVAAMLQEVSRFSAHHCGWCFMQHRSWRSR
jgi:hypothetical protein